MKRIVVFALLLLIFTNSNAADKVIIKTVVIDAGHGGKDPGAVGKIAMEKDVALSVALKVGKQISTNHPDIKVVYTRDKDIFIPLDERAKIARKVKADLFISIHANMISNPNTKGTETFVLGLHRSEDNLEVAKKENSVIVMEDDYTTTYEGFDPNLSESYIIFELIQNVYLDQSISIAQSVQTEMSANKLKRTNRGVKQAGFLVLRQASMPSILIETGFLSNTEEEKYLASAQGQDEIAKSIGRAFSSYKTNIEKQSSMQQSISKPTPKSGPVFKIQIASSKTEIKKSSKPLSYFSSVSHYKEGDKFKYTVSETTDVKTIKKELTAAKKHVKDAFIIAFDEDGNKLSSEKVKKLLSSN